MSYRPGWKTYTALGVVVVIASAVALLPWQRWADDWLRVTLIEAGIAELEISVESIGLQGVKLAGVEMPGGCHAGNITIRPGWHGTDVELSNARLQLEQREDGVWFCGSPLVKSKDKTPAVFLWPSWLGEVELKDTLLTYQAADIKGVAGLKGKVNASAFSVDATVTPAEDAKMIPVTALDLTLEGTFEEQRVIFEGKAKDATSALQITMKGEHAIDTGVGKLALYVLPVKFLSGGTQPDQLFPIIRGVIGVTQGTMSVDGTLGWSKEGLKETDIKVLLADVASVMKGVTLKGLEGEIALNSLTPVTTPPKQQLRVAEVDAGLPLSEGVISFQLQPDGMLELESTRWTWAGGELSTKAFSVNMGTFLTEPVVLEAKNLDLAEVLALALKEGLKATGVLEGNIPIMLIDGMPMLNNAVLKVAEPGVISYTPNPDAASAISGNAGAELLLKALKDFHFTMLELTMNSQDNSTMNALLKIQGSNPALYDGKAIHLNINLTIDYADLLRHGLQFMRLPETLQESLGQ